MISRLLIALLLCLWSASAQPIVIKMGTLAPKGTKWHDILLQMGETWKKVSDGKVQLKVYPGGEQGDEPAMVQKMRIKSLQSVALSGAGLSGIEPGVSALQIPLMIDSYPELDYVRDHISARLEKGLLTRGYVVLNWAGLTGLVAGQSYLRLRLTDAALTDNANTATLYERSIGLGRRFQSKAKWLDCVVPGVSTRMSCFRRGARNWKLLAVLTTTSLALVTSIPKCE